MIHNVDELRVHLDLDTGAPREARRRLWSWLADVECSESIKHDAVLVVSELVTNALVHAGSAASLVASFDDGRLRIEVHDHDDAFTRVHHELSTRPGGYGLRVVEQIGDAWGWRPTPSGKQVWVEILC